MEESTTETLKPCKNRANEIKAEKGSGRERHHHLPNAQHPVATTSCGQQLQPASVQGTPALHLLAGEVIIKA